MRKLVLDTNIVLDLFVFSDPRVGCLQQALEQGHAQWLGTPAMRDELERVLGYPRIAAQMIARGLRSDDVLARFDAAVSVCEAAGAAPVRCADEDDQKFIDLAAAQGASLLSRDAAVLALKKRLAVLGVPVDTA